MLFHYDMISVPLVYTQVGPPPLQAPVSDPTSNMLPRTDTVFVHPGHPCLRRS